MNCSYFITSQIWSVRLNMIKCFKWQHVTFILLLISIHVIKANSARHISFEPVNPTKVIKKWQRRNILNTHLALQNKWIIKKLCEISWAWVGIYCFFLGQNTVRGIRLMVEIFPLVNHNHLFLRRWALQYPNALRYFVFFGYAKYQFTWEAVT